MVIATSYSVDNDRAFKKALDQARSQVTDLTIPLTLISKDFFRSQKAIWQLNGPGQYPDLAPEYKERKQRVLGFVYPILKATGELERSMTDPTDPNAVNEIVNKNTLFVGTRVRHGAYHQSDGPRTKIPLRKFLFIGPEASRYAIGPQIGRLERWTNILNDYVKRKLESLGEVT